jgi:hypothetical protein
MPSSKDQLVRREWHRNLSTNWPGMLQNCDSNFSPRYWKLEPHYSPALPNCWLVQRNCLWRRRTWEDLRELYTSAGRRPRCSCTPYNMSYPPAKGSHLRHHSTVLRTYLQIPYKHYRPADLHRLRHRNYSLPPMRHRYLQRKFLECPHNKIPSSIPWWTIGQHCSRPDRKENPVRYRSHKEELYRMCHLPLRRHTFLLHNWCQ